MQDVDGDDIKIEEHGDVPLREWIALSKIERQITKRFCKFLNNFTPPVFDALGRPVPAASNGERVYPRRISDMCSGACAAQLLVPCNCWTPLTRAVPPCRLTLQRTSRALRCHTCT